MAKAMLLLRTSVYLVEIQDPKSGQNPVDSELPVFPAPLCEKVWVSVSSALNMRFQQWLFACFRRLKPAIVEFES